MDIIIATLTVVRCDTCDEVYAAQPEKLSDGFTVCPYCGAKDNFQEYADAPYINIHGDQSVSLSLD